MVVANIEEHCMLVILFPKRGVITGLISLKMGKQRYTLIHVGSEKGFATGFKYNFLWVRTLEILIMRYL